MSRTIDKLPKGVKDNLDPGENVISYLKTFTIIAKPDYAILTNKRVIYFNEEWLGRYQAKSIPFQKLLFMKAQRGIFFWGDISFRSENRIEYPKGSAEQIKANSDAIKEKINSSAEKMKAAHAEFMFRRVNRKLIEDFVNSLETAVNSIAVEPITIKHNKHLFGRSNWEFTKAEELVVRQQPQFIQQIPSEDPITKLKMRFSNGEITEEEYRARLKVLKEG